MPVSFKVAHEIAIPEAEPKLVDLVHRLGIERARISKAMPPPQ